MPDVRTYTSEEVSAIIKRALLSTGGADTVTHEDLHGIAREQGIDPARLEAAIRAEEEEGRREKAIEKQLRKNGSSSEQPFQPESM